MRAKSKIDLWISLLIWITLAIMLGSVVAIPENERYIWLLISIPFSLFMLWIYFGTYYELREEYLYFKCGPFFGKIQYDKIKSVQLSQNMLSSMALSIKRIEIRQHGKGYMTGTTYISPIDREVFMKELIKRCSNLENE